MGFVKSQFFEDQERGWSAVDNKYACGDCIDEPFLKEFVQNNATAHTCDYCFAESNEPISLSVEELQEIIFSVVYDYYADPTNAGVPYDKGFIIEPIDITDVLNNLGLDCNMDLWNDIVHSDHGNCYVRAAFGHWATSTESELLSYSWSSFENIVKYRTRFNFTRYDEEDQFEPNETHPRHMLDVLANHLQRAVITVQPHTPIYRARARRINQYWEPSADELGAPPPKIATGGRMNPPGIPYLYTAMDFNTAVYEARANHRTTSTVFVGQFTLTRPLKILDLTLAPHLPSIFDLDSRPERESVLFFESFVKKISQPIKPDDKVHLSYIPTQVVCEFLAQCFKTPNGESLDGIIFPSSLYSGGKNLVIFPRHSGRMPDFGATELQSIYKYQRPRKFSKPTKNGTIPGKIIPITTSNVI